jgi:TPR repeat protein
MTAAGTPTAIDRWLASAEAAFDGGDFRTAARWYRKAADAGSSTAWHALGLLYSEGWGVRRDVPRALEYYRKVWRKDRDTTACSNIALIHAQQGQRARARAWWVRAVEHGDGDAAYDFAVFLLQGGRDADEARARALLAWAPAAPRVSEGGAEDARQLLHALDAAPD